MNMGTSAVTVTTRSAQYVYSNKDNNFMKAFPKQFPYGISGPSDYQMTGRV